MQPEKIPNPKRVAAGRLNRLKGKPISPAARKKLSELAKARRPWQHSTGPKSPDGKLKVGQNSRKKPEADFGRNLTRDLAKLVRSLRKARSMGYVNLDATVVTSDLLARLMMDQIRQLNDESVRGCVSSLASE